MTSEVNHNKSIVQNHWFSLERAAEEVVDFERRFGHQSLWLAYHAAFPAIISPELLNLIHSNFLRYEGIQWITEVDFLLSSLCRPFTDDLFEVEPRVREILLMELQYRYGWRRLRELADFLMQYLDKNTFKYKREVVKWTHYLIAESYLNPDNAIKKMNNLLTQNISLDDKSTVGFAQKIHIATISEIVADPLSQSNSDKEYHDLLINSRRIAQEFYEYEPKITTAKPPTILDNPYRFTGPLDPDKDKIICAPRTEEINKVIEGINRGDYWSIMGPREIGITTFLFHLIKALSPLPCIYINCEIEIPRQEAFYEMIIKEIIEKVPAETVPDYKEWEKFGAEFYFYNFLKSLISRDFQKIVFIFDEIGRVPYVKSFLGLWRKVFHDRNHHRELQKFAVIISGAEDLIALTYGPTEPFNISKKLVLSNLGKEESERLIDMPMKALEIDFEPGIKEELIAKVSGHPQLLLHLCSLLVDEVLTREKKVITGTDLVQAIEDLFKKSDNLKTLKNQIKSDQKLHHLVQNIFDGEKIKYLRFQEYSQVGVGPIIDDEKKFCKLRSPLYEDYLVEIMEDMPLSPKQIKIKEEGEFITTVYCSATPEEFDSEEQEKEFLKQLFSEKVKIEIEKNGVQLGKIDFSSKKKLLLCYLAYKNYKAIKEGFSDWKSIPMSYKYRVSSNLQNNEVQEPEWEMFKMALKKVGLEFLFGDEIKAWTFSIRKKLATIDAKELIHSGAGKGSGYMLIGTVKFKRY